LTHPEFKQVARVGKFMQFAAERIRARKKTFMAWAGESSKKATGFDQDQIMEKPGLL